MPACTSLRLRKITQQVSWSLVAMFAAFERGYHACLEISSEKVKGQNEGRPAPALRAGSKDPPYVFRLKAEAT